MTWRSCTFLLQLKRPDLGRLLQSERPGLGWIAKGGDLQGRRLRRLLQSLRQPPVAYLTSDSSLNIGRYMLMMITPTIAPTPIIISGSMIAVSEAIAESTSSS